MKKRNYLLALAIAAALSITCFVGYGTPQKAAKTSSVITEDTASVTIEARNNDAKEINEKSTGYEGTETHTVVKDSVSSNNYIKLEGNTNYGITDYGFVPNTNTAPKAEPAPTPAPASRAVTDYHITDYGKTNYDDHTTDYGRTNYDDHVTDYGRTNYDNDFGYDD